MTYWNPQSVIDYLVLGCIVGCILISLMSARTGPLIFDVMGVNNDRVKLAELLNREEKRRKNLISLAIFLIILFFVVVPIGRAMVEGAMK